MRFQLLFVYEMMNIFHIPEWLLLVRVGARFSVVCFANSALETLRMFSSLLNWLLGKKSISMDLWHVLFVVISGFFILQNWTAFAACKV